MQNSAFVMSGGGAKGAFELGALDYLIRDKRVDPAVITGVSTGNLNAAMLAQGKGYDGLVEQLDRLEGIWFGIEEDDDIYTRRSLGLLGLVAKADSVYSNKPLWLLIRRYLDPELIRESGRILRVGVVGLKSGRYYAVDGRYPYIRRMVRASAAIPVAFNPVDLDDDANVIDDERFCDGGVRHVTPLSDAFDALSEWREGADRDDMGPDTVYVILASPLNPIPLTDNEELDDGIEIGKRGLDLLVNEVFRNDLRTAVNINAAVEFYERVRDTLPEPDVEFPFKDHRRANIVLIEPEKLYMGSLEFRPAKIERAFAAGREQAQEACAAAGTGSNVRPGDFSGAAWKTVLR